MPDEYILSPAAERTCRNCPLRDNPHVRKQVTTEVHPGPEGINGGIDLMFIAEAPGKVENKVGRPMIGGTGKILRRLVHRLNGGIETGIAYGNIVRCRPANEADPFKDRPPTNQELTCCRSNIMKDIARLRPRQIVLLGKSAATGLALDPITGERVDASKSIFALRGRHYVVRLPNGESYPATITYHFAFVSRSPGQGGIFQEDVSLALNRAKSVLPDYSQRGNRVVVVDKLKDVHGLLRHMVRGLDKNTVVAMDYETVTNTRLNNDVLTVGFSYHRNKAYVIPYKHPQSPWDGRELRKVRELLQKFFTTKKVSFRSLVGHNIKFECAVTLDNFGVPLWNLPLEDTMLRAHALNENRKSGPVRGAFGLKPLADEWLQFHGYEAYDIAPTVNLRNQGRLREADLEDLCEYNGMDCYVTYRLHEAQEVMAKLEGYDGLLRTLGLHMHGPASMFAAQMERNGILADQEKLRYLMDMKSPIVGRQHEIMSELKNLPSVKKANQLLMGQSKKTRGMTGIWGDQAGDPWLFKISQPASKQALFVDVLGLQTGMTETGKIKIDKNFYNSNKGIREIDLVSEWTALDKLRSTYVDAIYKMLKTNPDMQDGRIRASFNFHKTATSRTSSDRPNMQNIPKGKTATAKAVKSVYSVDPGNVMVCADYSQAEVRYLAVITGDKNLIRAFKNVERVQQEYLKNPTPENYKRMVSEGDFHRQTAAQIFGKQPEEITDLERGAAKAIVFGLIYGMTTYGLKDRLGISFDEAKDYQDKFLNQFPEARAWLERSEIDGFETGKALSLIGRCRHLLSCFIADDENQFIVINGKKLLTDIGKFKVYEDRVSRNAPVQSIASDTNLMACINIQRYIERHSKPWRLQNIVHDSIIAEIPWPDVREYIKVANDIMTDPDIMKPFGLELTVPFVADFTLGPNWGDQVDIDETSSKYALTCTKCETVRTEPERPKNMRCEECGSHEVRLDLKKGPLPNVLKYMNARYKLDQYWKAA